MRCVPFISLVIRASVSANRVELNLQRKKREDTAPSGLDPTQVRVRVSPAVSVTLGGRGTSIVGTTEGGGDIKKISQSTLYDGQL